MANDCGGAVIFSLSVAKMRRVLRYCGFGARPALFKLRLCSAPASAYPFVTLGVTLRRRDA